MGLGRISSRIAQQRLSKLSGSHSSSSDELTNGDSEYVNSEDEPGGSKRKRGRKAEPRATIRKTKSGSSAKGLDKQACIADAIVSADPDRIQPLLDLYCGVQAPNGRYCTKKLQCHSHSITQRIDFRKEVLGEDAAVKYHQTTTRGKKSSTRASRSEYANKVKNEVKLEVSPELLRLERSPRGFLDRPPIPATSPVGLGVHPPLGLDSVDFFVSELS